MKDKIPDPKFVGFFPKVSCPTPEGFNNDNIKEICSVSECVAKGPKDWIDKWEHNDLGFFDSEEKVLNVIENEKDKYCIYAYELYPLKFARNKAENYSIPVSPYGNLSNFEFLGYDIVSKSSSDFFECSLLSCNGLYEIYPVNQYCLIDNLENAYKYCLEIEKEKGEPGPYYLFKVYRKKIG